MEAYKEDKREPCKYGGKCYQKNPTHLSRFKHPPTNDDEAQINGDVPKQKNTEDNTGKLNGDVPKQRNKDGKNEKENAPKQKNTDKKKENEASPPNRDIRNFFAPKVDGKNGNGKRVDREETAPLAKKIKCDSKEDAKPSHKGSHAISSDEEEEEIENGTKASKHISSEDEDLGQKSSKRDSEENKTDNDDEIDEVSETFDDIFPPSPQNIRESIKQKFLVDMPEDFYQLYKLCSTLDQSSPCLALGAAHLQLVGPYDVLAGNIPSDKIRSEKLFLRHWRFYYDTPEFQTILTKTGDNPSQFHIGYFRDSPSDPPVFVGSNSAAEGPKVIQLGDNVFAAIYNHINNLIKIADPFSKSKLSSLQDKIKAFANDNGLSLDSKTNSMRQRDRLKMAPTFHGAGMVVPYDKKNTGWL